MSERSWTGGCLCGAVRYHAIGEALWTAHCHCQSCRRSTGGALATFIGFDAARFVWLGEETGIYHSSPGVTRRFCRGCGTPLSYEAGRFPGEVHIYTGTLDEPEAAAPTMHVFVAERLPWLRIADDLPRFAGSGSGAEPVGREDP